MRLRGRFIVTGLLVILALVDITCAEAPVSTPTPPPATTPEYEYTLTSPGLLSEWGIATFDPAAKQLIDQTVERLSRTWGPQASEDVIRIIHEDVYLSAAEIKIALMDPRFDLSMPLTVRYNEAALAIRTFDTISGGCKPPLEAELLRPRVIFVFTGDVGKFLESGASIEDIRDAPLKVAKKMFMPTSAPVVPEVTQLGLPYRSLIWKLKLEMAHGTTREAIIQWYNEDFVRSLEAWPLVVP